MSGATTRRKLVALGIVGTGPLWEPQYREALQRLSQRVVIRGVYDAVPARAELAAREWQAVVAPSLTGLFERPELAGILILDSAWHGVFPLDLACRFGKPVLLAGRWEAELARLEQLTLTARDAGMTVMTAFPHRHTPATNRLRELLATKLGPVHTVKLEIRAAVDETRLNCHQLIEWVDWCAYVVGKSPRLVSTSDTANVWQIHMDFPAAYGSPPPTADIVIREVPLGENASIAWQVNCQQGRADITGDTHITWQIGAEVVCDDLTSERSSSDIILDQFCRRVVGGLVPVSDLVDALRAFRVADAAQAQFGNR